MLGADDKALCALCVCRTGSSTDYRYTPTRVLCLRAPWTMWGLLWHCSFSCLYRKKDQKLSYDQAGLFVQAVLLLSMRMPVIMCPSRFFSNDEGAVHTAMRWRVDFVSFYSFFPTGKYLMNRYCM